jgi:hypothetical protein
MHRLVARALFGSLGSAAWLASCQSLPPTKPLISAAGKAGASASGSGGSAGTDPGAGGTAGTVPGTGGTSGTGTGGMGTGGSDTGGSGGNATGGSAGTAAEGGANDGGADSGGSAGTGGSSGKGGTGGSSGKGSGGSSGKGGSAGTGGAGGRTYSTDPTTFLGNPRCTSDLDFCEDFENASLDTQRWRIQTSGDNPAVVTTRAARGMRSAHFHTDDNGLALLHTSEPFPAANNRYYGRLFVWFEAMPTAPEWAHWTIAASTTDADESEIRVGGQYDNTINRFGVGTDHGPTGDWTNLDEDPGDPVPVGEWVCVEWLHDGQNDVTDLWWNGVARPSLHTTATDHGGTGEYRMPDIDSMFIGYWLYQPDTVPAEFNVWIDEVAIDADRIGCNN